MKPILLEFDVPFLDDPVQFHSYMVFMLGGFLLVLWLARREEDRAGHNGDKVVDLGILMLIFGVLGARIFSVLFDGQLQDFIHLCTDPKLVPAVDAKVAVCTADAQCGYDYLCDLATNRCYPPRDCLAALKFWQGGLTFYGGLVTAGPIGLWYARKKGLGLWRIGDLTAPFIMLGLFFGRLGCFFNGCCYGERTSSFLAVDFPSRHGVHPTQLYESFFALLIAAALYFLLRPRKRIHGQVFAAMLFLYGIARFFLEFWRADQRGELWGVSTSQWISIPLVALGAGIWVFRARQAGRDKTPA